MGSHHSKRIISAALVGNNLIAEIEKEGMSRYPSIQRIFIAAQSWPAQAADRQASQGPA